MTDQGPEISADSLPKVQPINPNDERQVRLASIVAIDVVGFSTMSERDQRRTASLIENLRTRIDAMATKNGGRIFNTAGDGFMLEFGSAGAALGFIQDMIDKRPKGQPPIRIGAHVGDVVVTVGNDLLGHGVNIAARLQSLAVPNTALVSGEFRSMARSSPSVAFQAKGRQPLENIDQKVQTFAILSGSQRFQRAATRGVVTLTAVAALTTLAFFGAQIEQFIQNSGIIEYVQNIAPKDKATTGSANATEAKPEVAAAPIAAPVVPAAPVRKPGDVFKDCDACPEMIVVPGGTFTMGSSDKEKPRFANEGPTREVTIKPIAVSRYEVTFAEWDACLAASECLTSPSDRGWGRAKRPVVGVSWQDAQTYIGYLNKRAPKPYRLLTEAEWEYAARAGGTSAYGATSKIARANANFGSNRSDPVGSYAANAFGLFDTAGNANEWVLDCYVQNYTGAPTDGSAPNVGACSMRAYRGGSYADKEPALRVANRRRANAELRDGSIGFRVARELE